MPLELIHKYCSSSPHRHRRRRRRRHNNYWHQFECASCIVHCAPLHRTLPHTHIHCRRYQFQSNSRWVKPPIFILRLNWFISSRVIGFGSVWYAEINLSSEERESERKAKKREELPNDNNNKKNSRVGMARLYYELTVCVMHHLERLHKFCNFVDFMHILFKQMIRLTRAPTEIEWNRFQNMHGTAIWMQNPIYTTVELCVCVLSIFFWRWLMFTHLQFIKSMQKWKIERNYTKFWFKYLFPRTPFIQIFITPIQFDEWSDRALYTNMKCLNFVCASWL